MRRPPDLHILPFLQPQAPKSCVDWGPRLVSCRPPAAQELTHRLAAYYRAADAKPGAAAAAEGALVTSLREPLPLQVRRVWGCWTTACLPPTPIYL